MDSDSRKAQHNSFAHHRAQLLFSRRLADLGIQDPWSASVHEGAEPADTSALADRVAAGLLGFTRAPANGAAA
jgi:hypothetical protein